MNERRSRDEVFRCPTRVAILISEFSDAATRERIVRGSILIFSTCCAGGRIISSLYGYLVLAEGGTASKFKLAEEKRVKKM